MHLSTQSIHVGQQADPSTGAIIPPLYLTSTYVQSSPGVYKGYDYTRSGNPTFSNAEKTLASLEQGRHAHLYSSGMGAMTTIILALLEQGDRVVLNNDVYGGTYRLIHNVFGKFGISYEQIDTDDIDVLGKALAHTDTKLLWIESPTNPLLKTSDIGRLAKLAHEHNVLLVVDNTFATPYFQQPLSLGADIVVHSTTKYLNGHSDVVGGASITNDPSIADALGYHRNASGINPNPFDAWLLSRSLKTLAVRMERHQANAQRVAQFLEDHPLVDSVLYPGISGMVSVEFSLSLEDMKQLISSFRLFRLAESLGGVESLVDHPASMTHASIPKDLREAQGLTDGLVRLSVGIENIDDLLEDLKQGLGKCG